MWRISKLPGALASGMLVMAMVLSGSANAATITLDDFPPFFGKLGDGTNDSGDTEDRVVFGISPDASSQIISIVADNSVQAGLDLTFVEILDSSNQSLQSVSLTGSDSSARLGFAYVAGQTYTLVIQGAKDTIYGVTMSAVPLPAAAWMLLSMMFGGAWLKRRGNKRSGLVAA